MAKVAGHYGTRAEEHATVTYQQRCAFKTSPVRKLNNFVKACLIDTAAHMQAGRPLAVADIAGGRGQDHSKWMYAAEAARCDISAYYGLDVLPTTAAEVMAAKYLTHAGTKWFGTADIGVAGFEGIPDASVHVVSCQLALHYLCDDEAHLRRFFDECARVLLPGGFALVSYVDGRAIVRRARNTLEVNDDDLVRVTRPYYEFSIARAHIKATIPSPFGCKYVFTLPGSVEGVPESLAHEGCIAAIAKRVGFHAGTSMSFDEAAALFVTVPRCVEIARKMRGGTGIEDPDARDTANLYRFTVFAREESLLRTWAKAMVQ